MVQRALGDVPPSYGLSLASGVMAAGLAAGSEIFQFRWGSLTHRAVIRQLRLWAGNNGTGFAAGVFRFQLFKVAAWSVDGSGGNAATLTGDECKKRNDAQYPTTKLSAARVSSTAALTAGTKTVASNPIASVGGAVPTTNGATIISPPVALLGSLGSDDLAPLVLNTLAVGSEEGLIIQATVPATGTWQFNVDIEWDEIIE